MASTTASPPSQAPPFPVRRFTVTEYHRMIESEVLGEDDRVELLEGWIVPKMPRNPRHDASIHRALRALQSRLPAGWHVRVQSAITLADSEPEPDLAVVLGSEERYRDRHPGAEDIAVAIEVADSSLAHDRGEKGRVYARAGIPVYWVVNLTVDAVEVYRDPSGPGDSPSYRERRTLGADSSLPLEIAGQEVASIPVRDLLV